ncbi:MAG: SurA N-terminal domain-containing protein, partial [Nitrospinota bacterium]|nr:SurA N-terminal domain-containing protein [Nitrospinota bacterium]
MLDVFREGAKTWISRFFIWVIAGTFVAAAFVVWGTGGAQRASAAATVGDDEITRAALYQRAKMIESNLRQQLGGQLDAQLLRSLDPESLALDALIEETLMRQAAIRAGIDVGDEETRETIMGMKEFLTDGVFDRRKYQDILQLNGYSTADFENSIRQGLLTERFRSLIQRPVTVSDAEVLDAYMKENQPVVVDYVELEEAPLRAGVKPSEAELKTWFESRKADYQLPTRRKMRIMAAYPSTFELSVSVTDEEARKYFDNHHSEFEAKEQVEASHILAKVSPGAPEETDKAALEKVEKALARAQAGEDFAALAKEISEDSTASSGGSLGRFSRGQMVQAFEEAVFALNVGEVSKPFKTPFGWHIVKLTDKIAAGTPLFENSKDLARIKAKKQKAAEEAKAAITTALVNITTQNFDERAAADRRLRTETL